MCDKPNERGQDLLPDEVASLRSTHQLGPRIHRRPTPHQLQHAQNSVDVPTFVGREALRRKADLRSHPKLELVIRDLEEGEQLADEDPDVLLIDERVR